MDSLSTGVAGLDELMRGGLGLKSTHLIVGPAGVGKTVLAQQIGFYHASRGRNVLYLTALTETVGSLVTNVRRLSFADPKLVAQRMYYMNVYTELQDGGLPGVLDEVRRLVREYKVELVLLDGLKALKCAASSVLEFRLFLLNLVGQLHSLGATTVLTSAGDVSESSDPEATVADGIVQLNWETFDGQLTRFVEVVKLRNVAHLTGRHAFVIDANGLTVYPRLEATLAREGVLRIGESVGRARTGVAELDRLMSGGLPSGTVTLVVGESGTGRTLLGLSFLNEGARHQEKGLYFGFHEAPARLVAAAEGIGLKLNTAVGDGMVFISWHPLLDPSPDQLAQQLLTAVKDRGISRVFIDGVDSYLNVLFPFNRRQLFLEALNNVLRTTGVTTVMSTGPRPRVASPASHDITIDAVVDNIVLLSYAESGPHLRRLVSVAKMRGSEHDNTLHEFTVSGRGIEVTKPFEPDGSKPIGLGRVRGRRVNG